MKIFEREKLKETVDIKQAMYTLILDTFKTQYLNEDKKSIFSATMFVHRKNNILFVHNEEDLAIRFKFNRKGLKVIVDTPSELCSVKFDNDEYDVLRRRVRNVIND